MLTKFRQLGIVASAVASRATSIDVLVGMSVLQFVAVAPMLSLGAGSLAECYDAHERGLKVSKRLLLYEVVTDSKRPVVGHLLCHTPHGTDCRAATRWRDGQGKFRQTR
jgi:hypothetical protein